MVSFQDAAVVFETIFIFVFIIFIILVFIPSNKKIRSGEAGRKMESRIVPVLLVVGGIFLVFLLGQVILLKFDVSRYPSRSAMASTGISLCRKYQTASSCRTSSSSI